MLSACNGLGMLGAGWLCDRASRTILLSAIFAIRGLDYLMIRWATSRASLFAFSAVFGFVDYRYSSRNSNNGLGK